MQKKKKKGQTQASACCTELLCFLVSLCFLSFMFLKCSFWRNSVREDKLSFETPSVCCTVTHDAQTHLVIASLKKEYYVQCAICTVYKCAYTF